MWKASQYTVERIGDKVIVTPDPASNIWLVSHSTINSYSHNLLRFCLAVDPRNGFRRIHFRCAVSVKRVYFVCRWERTRFAMVSTPFYENFSHVILNSWYGEIKLMVLNGNFQCNLMAALGYWPSLIFLAGLRWMPLESRTTRTKVVRPGVNSFLGELQHWFLFSSGFLTLFLSRVDERLL